ARRGNAQEPADGASARSECAEFALSGPQKHARSHGAACQVRQSGRCAATARSAVADDAEPADGAPGSNRPGARRRDDVDARRAWRHDPEGATAARQDLPPGPGPAAWAAARPAGSARTAWPARATRATRPAGRSERLQ